MGNVVTLPDLIPAARYDGNPWTELIVGEAASASGPFSTIDTVTLSPQDTDPTNPQPRSVTTSAATLTSGWYQVTFQDAAGGQQVLTPIDYPPPATGPAAGYCSVLDVQARTSSRPVTASSLPSIAQVQGFILEAAAEINAILTNKGYLVPVNGASNPDAFATLHAANVAGGWAMMEQAAPTSLVKDAALAAWEAAKKMLSDAKFVLNAPQDIGKTEARGPWVTSTPSGDTYDPMWGKRGNRPWNNPRNPYFSREQRYKWETVEWDDFKATHRGD